MEYRYLKGTSQNIIHEPREGRTGLFDEGSLSEGRSYKFLTAIVKEVISNPEELLLRIAKDEAGDDPKDDLNIKNKILGLDGSQVTIWNSEVIPYVPMNSIIAHILDATSDQIASDIICFPFFPPHLSLPVKPGEYVWLLQEDAKGADIFYWMCRKVGIRQVDDINLTHLERTNDVTDAYRAWQLDGTSVAGDQKGNISKFDNATDGTGLDEGNTFTEIHRTSIAFKEEFTGEPVPRLAKDCADLLLQGSNNSHIMLGTEKFTIPEDNALDERLTAAFLGERLTGQADVGSLTKRKPLSPAIDLCIGRKRTDILDFAEKTKDDLDSAGKGAHMAFLIANRPESDLDLEFMEVDKTLEIQDGYDKDVASKEFTDLNALNCLGRIYMTNSIDIDRTFGFVANENTAEDGFVDPNARDDENSAELDVADDETGYPEELAKVMNYGAIAMYSTNLRFRSDATMKMYNSRGKSMITMTPQGDIVLQANTEGGAKIILEWNGNIRIVPGKEGLVKIGADLKTEDEEATGLSPACGAISAESYTPGDGRVAEALFGIGLVSGAAGAITADTGGTGALATQVILK